MRVIEQIESGLKDSGELFALAKGESDDDTLVAVRGDAAGLEKLVAGLEFQRMFANPMDPNNCFVDINAGQGGTEAQDWTQMLLRMYLKYCDKKGYKVEVLEESEGEVAGLKSASIKVNGPYAYGYLRTETGIHRLVRKSPFDSTPGATPRSRASSSTPRSTTPSRWRSTPRTCASTPTAPPGPAGST